MWSKDMAKSYRIELNREGVRELLRSAEMAAVCKCHADRIAARAGSGYEVTTYTGKNRVNASVHAATEEAYRDNLKNNTLLKAVSG